MNLYLLTRSKDASDVNYDDYDSAVVAAETEDDAKTIHPNGNPISEERGSSWVRIDHVIVEYIGIAKPFTKRGVICASFNAG